MKSKPQIQIKGNKKDGWVIIVYDNGEWRWDLAVTNSELIFLKEILNKKIK